MSNGNASKRSGPPPIVFILLLLGLLGGAFWFFVLRPKAVTVATPPEVETLPPGSALPRWERQISPCCLALQRVPPSILTAPPAWC